MGEERKEMTPEKINKAIAEQCGWTCVRYSDAYGGWQGYKKRGNNYTQEIPDFYHDLNACAEMVKGFNLEEARKFSDHLKVAIQRDQFINSAVDARYMTANATAPQRCEAFLRTKGLWVEKEGVK